MARLSVSLSRQMEDLIFSIAQQEGVRPSSVVKRAFALLKVAQDAQRKGDTLAVVRQVTSDGEFEVRAVIRGECSETSPRCGGSSV